MVALPKRLQEVLNLSVNITGRSDDIYSKEGARSGLTKTKIRVEGGNIFFDSQSFRGHYTDNIKLPNDATHKDCKSIYVDPRYVYDGCSVFEKIAFTESAIIMTGSRAIYLVSCSIRPPEEQ